MQVFFDDLALPHLIRTQLAEVPEWKSHRAGFISDGKPDQPARGALDARRPGPAHRDGRRPRREIARARSAPAAPAAQPARGRCAVRREIRETEEKLDELRAASPSAFPSSTRSTCATATASRARAHQPRR